MSDPDVTPEPLTDELDPYVIVGASPLSTKRYHYRGFDLELDSVHSSPVERHHAVAKWRKRVDDLFPLDELEPVIVAEVAKPSKPAKTPKAPKSRRSPRGPAA